MWSDLLHPGRPPDKDSVFPVSNEAIDYVALSSTNFSSPSGSGGNSTGEQIPRGSGPNNFGEVSAPFPLVSAAREAAIHVNVLVGKVVKPLQRGFPSVTDGPT